MRPPNRSAVESRYRDLRHLAFREATANLAAVGIRAELRALDASALDAFTFWQGRRVFWPWPEMAADWRRGYPERFELAVWSGSTLCALALGRPSSSPSHLSLYYLEANPDRSHALAGQVATIVFTAMEEYATILNKGELRLVDPLPEVIRFYCSPAHGFELVSPHREAPYCRRSI
jgi:hypothetical protein